MSTYAQRRTASNILYSTPRNILPFGFPLCSAQDGVTLRNPSTVLSPSTVELYRYQVCYLNLMFAGLKRKRLDIPPQEAYYPCRAKRYILILLSQLHGIFRPNSRLSSQLSSQVHLVAASCSKMVYIVHRHSPRTLLCLLADLG